MNEQQLAQLALQFLTRVNLTGQELEAFVVVRNWLVEKSQPQPEVVIDAPPVR
jgi:hypothetical protein